jgi:nucleoside-diphosphate-sugar epimerase
LIRDFIDVRDAVKAIGLILEKGEFDSIWNVGMGVPQSVEQIIFFAHKLIGRGEVLRVPVPEFHKQVQVQDMYLNTTKLDDLGFKPEHDVYETVKEIAEFYAKG